MDYDIATSTILSDDSMHDYDGANAAIDSLASKYGNVSCAAHITHTSSFSSYAPDYDGTVDVNTEVSKWRRAIQVDRDRYKSSQSPLPVTVPSYPSEPSQPSLPATEIPHTVTVEVIDADQFNRQINELGSTTEANQIQAASGSTKFCELDHIMPKVFKQGDKISFTMKGGSASISGNSSDFSLIMICSSYHSDESNDFTVFDLQQIFSGLAKVTSDYVGRF